MEERNGRDAISLPRWESFLINSQEFGGDFPAGPYNRMISKLYGTGSKSSEIINNSRMDNQHSSLGSAGGQPLYPLHERDQSKSPNRSFSASVQPREDDMATSSHSGSQPLLCPDEKRQEDASGKLALSGAQVVNGEKQDEATRKISLGIWPKHTIEEPRQDTSSTRFNSGRELMKKPTREDDSVRFGPMSTEHMERSKRVNETRLAPASVQPKHLTDEARVDSLPDRLVTGHGPPAGVPESKLDTVAATLVSADGQSKEHDDKVKVDGAPPGVIFMCNRRTRETCFQYGVFGLPSSQLQLVKRIVPGTKLFLFVLDSRELQGIFEATSNGGLSLDPEAFSGAFQSQVRFRICRECKSLYERDFRKAIKDNYFSPNKFKNELTSKQVSTLIQLFCPEGFVDGKVQSQQNLLGHSIAGGSRGISVLDLAEIQSEKSMEISPQNSPTAGCGEDIFGKERDYLTNSSDNCFRSSLYSSSLQPRGSCVLSHIFSERADEDNFQLKEKHEGSLHPSYTSSSLQSRDGGISGLRFCEDIEKDKFHSHDSFESSDHYVSKSSPWFHEMVTGKLIEQNKVLQSNPVERKAYTDETDISGQEKAVHLNRVYHIYEKEQHRPEEDLEVYGSQGFSLKRVPGDTVNNTSNSHPWKKPHYYSESYEDIMLKEKVPSVNGVPVNADWMRNVSQVGNRIEEQNPMQVFPNIHHVPNPQELERGLVSQPPQSGLPRFSGPIGGPTFTNPY